jgi:hypothetical protein
MIKRSDKHGLSNIVATLIVILLVLVAVAILWTVIRAFIQRSTDEITLSKFTIDLKIDSASKNNLTVNVVVKRNPGAGDLKGITFIIFDGENSHIIERKEANFSLNELERRIFTLTYSGPITKISIAPMFETKSGKIVTGSITDVYYMGISGLGGSGSGNCTSGCGSRQCGPDPTGCEFSCGSCPLNASSCNNGVCEAPTQGCNPDCSCASTTCEGQFCGECNNCSGTLTLAADCGMSCGGSPHSCGFCASCDTGYHCDNGICVVSCIADCGTRNCGPVPNACGENCGLCNVTAGEWCDSGYCSNETCVPDCGTRNCGPVPNGCQESGGICGLCNSTAGEYCSSEGICLSETYLNTGNVFSVWPINIGIYIDSNDLPTEGVDYTNYYVKFTTGSENRCLQIREFVTPVIPAVYNMSYIRFVTSVTTAKTGDTYQIWETYQGCTG